MIAGSILTGESPILKKLIFQTLSIVFLIIYYTLIARNCFRSMSIKQNPKRELHQNSRIHVYLATLLDRSSSILISTEKAKWINTALNESIR